jgi:hypothetical protein
MTHYGGMYPGKFVSPATESSGNKFYRLKQAETFSTAALLEILTKFKQDNMYCLPAVSYIMKLAQTYLVVSKIPKCTQKIFSKISLSVKVGYCHRPFISF